MTAAEQDDRTIHQRMVAILAALPALGKTRKNEQQNFMFRGHDDVMDALNPLLATHGVFVVPSVLQRVSSERKTAKGGTLYEVSLEVGYTFHGLTGDNLTASVWGEGTDSGDKATSKAMTMAYKTALAQAFAISTKELGDPDAATSRTGGARQTNGSGAKAPASLVAEVDGLIARLNEQGVLGEVEIRDGMVSEYSTSDSKGLTVAQASDLKKRLSEKLAVAV